MASLFMTGFPGFLGSALLPKLLARRPKMTAVCLVQPHHMTDAETRLKALEEAFPHTVGRIDLITGDITASDLGIDSADQERLSDVREVWHLAAVYDLTAPEAVASKVNIEGTANVLRFCESRTRFKRLQYVSTCYVSGKVDGEFTEDELDLGQDFFNFYESTKYAAEMLVREAMDAGLPATIYRPGIVVGDSTTGETQKYDGPYFLAAFMRRQASVAVIPAVGDADEVKISLVPRDFVVEAMDELSVLDVSLGRTYALTDPNPPTVRELVDAFADELGKRIVWVPLPLAPVRGLVGNVPGMERLLGLPAEGLDYFASRTTYDTTNTVTDLAETGLVCPPFKSYVGVLMDFMTKHPEIDSSAMV